MSRNHKPIRRRYWTNESVVLSVRIPRELKRKLQRLAREAQVSLNRFVSEQLAK